MKANELREKYLSFFEKKGHSIIKSSSLVPENDPSVLFTTAGMHPLVPYLLGETHPQGKRLAGVQKCVRTGDIDEVGDHCHLTFFEMLGNWSLGDYFKKDAIEYSFEFLTSKEWLGIPLERLAFTVFEGNADAPFDDEAFNHWTRLGVSESRIARLPKENNWWERTGQPGPCGPDTEMFYWVSDEPVPDVFNPADTRWVEIWNDVFMQYNRLQDGAYVPLSQKNVDTGMGLERTTVALQGRKSVYETELFAPMLEKLDEIRNCRGAGERNDSERIIVDHLRSATFMMGDGVAPSNIDQGYVLRRLMRRAIREGRKLGIKEAFTSKIIDTVVQNYSPVYTELARNRSRMLALAEGEEKQFGHTLEKGTIEFEKLISRVPPNIQKKVISGKNAFFLYETYGFPIELTEEMAKERGFSVDREGFQEAYRKHQELSRQGAEQKFKGGLADQSEKTTALHTATHLLHESLRRVIGKHVEQKGSNITADRLRFDFSHPDKMTEDQVAKVESMVNDVIKSDMKVSISEMTVDEATREGAIGLFGDRYGDKVKVYAIGDFSKEICGGPHVEKTSSLGTFKIQKEESSSKGVRRIKAVLV